MDSSRGGIRADRIEAHNIVSGVQLSEGTLSDKGLLELAQLKISGGAIDADSIRALNVVAGVQVTEGAPEDLRRQMVQQLGIYRADLIAISDGVSDEFNSSLVQIAGEMAHAQAMLTDGSDIDSINSTLSTAVQKIGAVADAAEQTGRAVDGVGRVAAGLVAVAGVISRAFGVW